MPTDSYNDIAVVFFDPPFGLKIAPWDQVSWEPLHFTNVLTPLLNISHPILIVFFLTEKMILDVIPIINHFTNWTYSIVYNYMV